MADYPQREEQAYREAVQTAAQSSTQILSDLISLSTHVALSKAQQVRAKVDLDSPDRLAEHDLADAREMFKEGMSAEDIKIEISTSTVAKDCDRPDVYVDCIVNTAERHNILEDSPIEISIEHNQDLQL